MACAAVGVSAVLYGLAELALFDLEKAPSDIIAGNAAGAVAAAANADGTATVWRDGLPVATVRGHGAALALAQTAGSGGPLVTLALDGSLRSSDLASIERAHRLSVPWLSDALWESLWQPFGLEAARWSLSLVARALPIAVPASLAGKRGRLFKDCADCPEMIEIGPGAAFIGSPLTELGRQSNEGPRQLVMIDRPLAVGRFEVTLREWTVCLTDGACGGSVPLRERTGSSAAQGLELDTPMTGISWEEATAYTAWLSKRTGKAYRLLSEVEWEYAARAGSATPYPLGTALDTLTADVASGVVLPRGSYAPNRFGLFDMHQSVAEWTQDCSRDSYGEDLSPAPFALAGVCVRVVRGGGSRRSAERQNFTQDVRDPTVGLRVARTLDP